MSSDDFARRISSSRASSAKEASISGRMLLRPSGGVLRLMAARPSSVTGEAGMASVGGSGVRGGRPAQPVSAAAATSAISRRAGPRNAGNRRAMSLSMKAANAR